MVLEWSLHNLDEIFCFVVLRGLWLVLGDLGVGVGVVCGILWVVLRSSNSLVVVGWPSVVRCRSLVVLAHVVVWSLGGFGVVLGGFGWGDT